MPVHASAFCWNDDKMAMAAIRISFFMFTSFFKEILYVISCKYSDYWVSLLFSVRFFMLY